MKRRFLVILVLCAAMLFGGCREGGADMSGGYSFNIRTEEFNVGERTENSTVSSRSSSSIAKSSLPSQSILSNSDSSNRFDSTESDAISSTPVIVVIQSVESSLSEVSDASSSLPKSSSAPIVVVIPEEPPKSSLSASVVPDYSEPVEDDPPANIGDVQPNDDDDTPAGVSDVISKSGESSSEEPSESLHETSESPYDYDGEVYVAASGNGKKYHKNPKCSNMNGSLPMSVDEALKKGYTPCKKCW